jgi:hypothetical protein
MGENILNDSFCQFSGALILFLDHPDMGSRPNISSVSFTHLCVQEAPIPPPASICLPAPITNTNALSNLSSRPPTDVVGPPRRGWSLKSRNHRVSAYNTAR